MVKGSRAWKEISLLIITAILIPILAWGSSAFISLREKVAVIEKDAEFRKETIIEVKDDVKEIKSDIKELLKRRR